MIRALKYLIQWATGTSVNDNAEYRLIKIVGNEKESTVHAMSLYGLAHNPPDGSLLLVMQVGGSENNRVALADFPQARFAPLKAGEIALWSVHGQYLHFTLDGDINIWSPRDINLRAAREIHLQSGVSENDKLGNGVVQFNLFADHSTHVTPDHEVTQT